MHYYNFNISDYRRDTMHLTHEEHYIYRELIDMYYESEKPIPLDKRKLLRFLKCTTDQLDTLDNVLNDFFVETEKGYKHPRIEAELARWYEKSAKARASINARWQKHTNVSKNDTNVIRTYNERNTDDILPNDLIPNDLVKDSAPDGAVSKPKVSPCPYQRIVDLYHEKLPMLPKVVTITPKRKSHMRARWSNGANSMDYWRDYFEAVATSKFLTGRTQPSPGRKVFMADIDFLIREDVLVKTQEGKYHE